MTDDTTFYQRSKTFCQKPGVQRGALGSAGGVSLALIYTLFVTKSQYNADRQDAKEKAAVQWRQLMTLDNTLDATRLDLEKLKAQVEFLRLRQ